MKKAIINNVKILFTTLISILLLYSCTEEFDYGKSENAVKTLESSDILQTTAVVSGTVITDNGASLTARGICYSTNNNPTISGSKKPDTQATLGSFICTLTNLSPSTTYFARAYATNSYGTAYGGEVTFTTQAATIPIIASTTAASLITQISASSGGLITNSGASNITSRGVCYSNTSTNPTIANSKTNDGTGTGQYTSSLTNLAPNTIYYIRAYATNGVGTAYGDAKSFRTTAATFPVVSSTTAASFITQTTAISGGNVTSESGAAVTSRGVCWSNTTSSPTILNSKTVDGTGLGTFTSSLTSLAPGITYYVRAYATNSVGTGYGPAISVRTLSATIPTSVTTNTISSITQTTATGGGNISNDGGAAVTSRGVCWSNTTSSPTTTNSKTIDGTGIGTFTSSLTGLLTNTTYYVRAYATNSAGTAYGPAISVRTLSATIPTGVTTKTISSITQTTANSGGTVSNDGGAPITTRGVCWSNTTSSPTISNSKSINGSGTGSFTSSIIDLSPNTTYFVRAYATNSVGTAYGSYQIITTSAVSLPSGITTTTVSSITQTTASSGGSVSNDGGATITAKGVCWSNTTSIPTINNSITTNGAGAGTFSSSLTGLTSNTTYYVRAYATNSAGTAYGSATSFTTSASTLSVGQRYQGGIIAYIFRSGDSGYIAGQTHGLIATTSNQSTGAQWGCSGTSISTSTSFGTGQTNTTSIVNGCSTSGIAARICNDLVSGGYSDWYLPSYYELEKLYINRALIGGFSSTYYLSSSQLSSTEVYGINFSDGYGYALGKISALYVRAIRKF